MDDTIYTRENTAIIPSISHFNFFKDGTEIGTLVYGPPMRFEGDMEASAKEFFEEVVKRNNARITELEQQLAELQAWRDKAFEAVPNLDLDIEAWER